MNYENTLIELVKENPNIMVLTAENRAAIRNLPEIIPNNFIDCGIAEQTMCGMSAGLALRGRIPIIHALATFLTMRSFEFIRTDIGIGKLPVKIVGGVAGFLSEANGPTHQAIEDIGLMSMIPGMEVYSPADEDDLVKCLKVIIESEKPAYIRYTNVKAIYNHVSSFTPGQGEIISNGKDIMILTYGLMFNNCYELTNELNKNGISAGLVNMRSIKPIDETVINSIVKAGIPIVTVEDHLLRGGLYTSVLEVLNKNGLSGNVKGIALDENWFKPGLLKDVIEYEGFSPKQLLRKVTEYIQTIKKNQDE